MNMVDEIKAKYPKGTRIELIKMVDVQSVPSGTKGTVDFVDDMGTIHMKWDNGRRLGLVLEVDEFEIIKEENNMNEKTLMQMLIEAGYPIEEIHHHESDLYVYVTPLTTRVLEEWCEANGWKDKMVKEKSFVFDVFTDNFTGMKMYDIAFQYTPWWDSKLN